MIRILNVYYPTRTLVLLLLEALVVSGSFLLATAILVGPDTYIALIYENGLLKIAGITVITFASLPLLRLYEPQRISGRWEIYFRLLLLLSVLSFFLAGIVYLFSDLEHRPQRPSPRREFPHCRARYLEMGLRWILGLSILSRTRLRPEAAASRRAHRGDNTTRRDRAWRLLTEERSRVRQRTKDRFAEELSSLWHSEGFNRPRHRRHGGPAAEQCRFENFFALRLAASD